MNLKTTLPTLAILVNASLALVACNTILELREPIIEDAGAPADAFVEAPHPALPQLQKYAGTVITEATIVPVTFPGFPFTDDVNALTQKLADAGYWNETVKEYGVTVSAGAPIILTEAAPATIDAYGVNGVGAWLTEKLTGDGGTFGPPSSSTVYVIYYPATTVVTNNGAKGCIGFGSYWETLPFDKVNQHYVVVPVCAGLGGANGLTADMTGILLNVLTFPYHGVDKDYATWEWNLTPQRVGALCWPATTIHTITLQKSGYEFIRGWSNEAAAAGHDPCKPALGAAYFNTAAELLDTVDVIVGSAVKTKGVLIPKGQSKTIKLDLFSDAPTNGPWAVSVTTLKATGAGDVTFALDHASGKNGDVLNLTITASAHPTHTYQEFVINSTLGNTTNYNYGVVGFE